MEVISEPIWDWWKPRFILNHKLHLAYEWIDMDCRLLRVTQEDIDWRTMKHLPPKAITRLKELSFWFPSFILDYKSGVAEVRWQLIPDGRYYMDDDGYGMTDDDELNVYGFIDKQARVCSPFRYYTPKQREGHILERDRKAAIEKLRRK